MLVADKFEKSGLDGLKALGVDVAYEPDLKDEALESAIKEGRYEVLIVRSTNVTAPMIEGSGLKLIVRAGAGYNTIDVAAAERHGAAVANCPGKNSIAVAELAMGLMISCDRRIPDNVASLRGGKWNKKEFSKARGLYGRTLGLVGMGNIAQEVALRARAFGMEVVVFNRWMTADIAAHFGFKAAATVEDLAALSDFISVHLALNPHTKGLIGKRFFEAMKPGSVFINTSRAEIVDQSALEATLETKGIWAGLDVFEDEPPGGEGEYTGSLRNNPRVYCTHHIGASTDQAQEAVAAETVRIVTEFKNTGVAPNRVSTRPSEPATHVIVVRHSGGAAVLARVIEDLGRAGVAVQEMEFINLGNGHPAIAQLATSSAPSEETLAALRKHEAVAEARTLTLPL